MTEPVPEAAQSENLTSALRRCGALTNARVSGVRGGKRAGYGAVEDCSTPSDL